MRPLILLTLLALLTLGLCRRVISKHASAEVVRRHKRNYIYDSSIYGIMRDPLEAKREVCELNPDCDELADHIGFQEAYRRFYGPV
ncbi:PREDICTED: osteocalcin [Phaethon lepturus]|uniref:osteocalcin n=1 Tax=Phaethon lepturus TaxID=97097 RepID=UPI000530B650|nr:PREDICTED: osteocalcin [Phaethon lepturus]